ncbi:MAG: hypothetical protein IJY39_13155 [Clostridia bacterium]|nr:hypothetical protein [Clostridia bacterium]
MEKENKKQQQQERSFDEGTRPGAYINDYDIDNELLDTVDSADDDFTENIRKKGKWANPASPPAADPPVPNRAHTEI